MTMRPKKRRKPKSKNARFTFPSKNCVTFLKKTIAKSFCHTKNSMSFGRRRKPTRSHDRLQNLNGVRSFLKPNRLLKSRIRLWLSTRLSKSNYSPRDGAKFRSDCEILRSAAQQSETRMLRSFSMQKLVISCSPRTIQTNRKNLNLNYSMLEHFKKNWDKAQFRFLPLRPPSIVGEFASLSLKSKSMLHL